MLSLTLPVDCDEELFRDVARQCLAQKLAPEQVMFTTSDRAALFEAAPPGEGARVNVPRSFLRLVAQVLCHQAADRFALLYRLLWRMQRGKRGLLDRSADADVMLAMRYAKAVERDAYHMRAYVRFNERVIDGRTIFVAWHEPQHRILRYAAPFFVDRFPNMDWLIATPIGTLAWRDQALTLGPPGQRPPKGEDAVMDDLWTTYYRVTFNPARLRVKAMVAQMPKRHWRTMPEAAQVPGMVRQARARVDAMEARTPDEPPRFAEALARHASPAEAGAAAPDPLEALRREARACTRCPLHVPATQTVFGEGPADASVVFVGEQPGDQEDLAGRPFVGPAGQMFDRALAAAGIDREQVYVTNTVKHFKFEPRGKRRLHSKPGTEEVRTCRFWLEREIAAIKPRLIVALGATAALGVTGRAMAVTKVRGQVLDAGGQPVLVTVHPSYLLRLPDPALADAEYERFVQDLGMVKPWCERAA